MGSSIGSVHSIMSVDFESVCKICTDAATHNAETILSRTLTGYAELH